MIDNARQWINRNRRWIVIIMVILGVAMAITTLGVASNMYHQAVPENTGILGFLERIAMTVTGVIWWMVFTTIALCGGLICCVGGVIAPGLVIFVVIPIQIVRRLS